MENKVITAQEFVDILELRTELILLNEGQLKEIFKDDKEYCRLVKTMYNLLDIDDCGFALLDENVMEKIYSILSLKRFEMKHIDKNIFDQVNEMISRLNEMKAKRPEEKEKLLEGFILTQEEFRDIEYEYFDEVIDSMATDYFVFNYLEGEELPPNMPETYLIGSIIYLNNAMPKFFEIDEVREREIELFEEMQAKNTKPSKYFLLGSIKRKLLKR